MDMLVRINAHLCLCVSQCTRLIYQCVLFVPVQCPLSGEIHSVRDSNQSDMSNPRVFTRGAPAFNPQLAQLANVRRTQIFLQGTKLNPLVSYLEILLR